MCDLLTQRRVGDLELCGPRHSARDLIAHSLSQRTDWTESAPMDGPTTILLVLAALPIFALGVGLLVAPARTTAALNEWYVIPPSIRADQRIRLALVRAAGVGLMVLAVGLEIRAVALVISLST